MRPRGTVGKAQLLIWIVAVAVGLAFPVWARPFTEGLATTALLMLVMTVSWNIVGGFGGQLSFGHAAFYGAGAYTSAILITSAHLAWPLALLAGGVAAALVAVLIIPCFRTRGTYFAILTLALAESLRLIGGHVLPGGQNGLFITPIFPIRSHTPYYLALAAAALSVVVAVLVYRSRLGLGLRALKRDLEAAESVGVNTLLIRSIAFLISAALTGVAGGLYATTQTFVDPGTVFDVNLSLLPVLMATLGGMGTIAGPVIGAILWSVIDEGIRGLSSSTSYSVIVYGALLLLLAIFLPQGIVGLYRRVASRWSGRGQL